MTQAIPSRSDFSQGSISQAIFRQAGPMTVALLVNMLYSVVDRIYLGHIPGEGRLALTGIGLAFPIIAVISAFQRLCSDGGAPLCAMARGAGELERAETIQGNAYTLLLLFSLLLIALGYAFKAPILWATGAGEATFPYADAYLRIYLVGTIFVLPSLGMNAFITGQGFPTVSMMTVLLGAVVNILLDPLFIFVFDMGVQGAALATVIAQFTSFLWVLLFLTSHRAILRLRLNRMRLQRNIVLPMLGLGLTGFTMSVTNSAVGMVYNASLQTLGGDLYVGVMTVVNSIREIIYMPVSGLTAGAQPVISFNYGARCYSRTKKPFASLPAIASSTPAAFGPCSCCYPRPLSACSMGMPPCWTPACPLCGYTIASSSAWPSRSRDSIPLWLWAAPATPSSFPCCAR